LLGRADDTVTALTAGVVQMQAFAQVSGTTYTSDTVTFNVTVGSPTQIELTGPSGPLASGDDTTLTAVIKDGLGNAVLDYMGLVTFAGSAGSADDTVRGLGSAIPVDGVATITISGARAGTANLVASTSFPGLTSNTVTVTVVPGPVAAIALAASANGDLPAAQSRTFTATMSDSNGNAVTSVDDTITFVQFAGAGTLTGLPLTCGSSPCQEVRASGGAASVTLVGDLIGPIYLEATTGGLSSNAQAFDVVVGAPAALTLTSSGDDSLTAGTSRSFTATLTDARGNVTTNVDDSVITFSQTAGNGAVSGLGNTTATDGVAARTVTATTAGSVTLRAATGALSDDTTFPVVAAAASQLTITTQPGGMGDDTVLGQQPSVRLLDPQGNDVAEAGRIVVGEEPPAGHHVARRELAVEPRDAGRQQAGQQAREVLEHPRRDRLGLTEGQAGLGRRRGRPPAAWSRLRHCPWHRSRRAPTPMPRPNPASGRSDAHWPP